MNIEWINKEKNTNAVTIYSNNITFSKQAALLFDNALGIAVGFDLGAELGTTSLGFNLSNTVNVATYWFSYVLLRLKPRLAVPSSAPYLLWCTVYGVY